MLNNNLSQKIYGIFKKSWIYIIGFGALIWFLVRVIPKPSRAAYPCQRAAFPIASAFVLWIAAVFSTSFLFRKVRAKFAESKYGVAAILLVITALASFFVITPVNFTTINANPPSVQEDFIPIDAPNEPVGVGRGIFPGRVVWSYDTASTSWSGGPDFWWSDTSIDSVTVKYMLSRAIQELNGAESDSAAWDSTFRYFNRVHDKGDIGYSENEKIAIKLNMNMIKSHDQESNAVTVSPQVVQALLRQLVYEAKVPASAISFYDISRYVPDFIFDPCKEEFPDVHFIDNSMGENGREPFSMDINTVIHWSDTAVVGQDSYLPVLVTEADYIINLGNLKAHKLAGITICAKNHFGTYASNAQGTSGPVDAGVHPFIAATDNLPQFGTTRDMGTYNALVDLMGHKDLGEKTLLFLVDALHNPSFHNTNIKPENKLLMAPFNGDWMSSLFVSFDGVAIESVGLDFLRNEPGPSGDWIHGNIDNYLHEAALANDPPSAAFYDPEGDGIRLISLGVHEHWNDHINKQYSRNLGKDEGIELVYVDATSGATDTNPIDTIPIDTIPIDTIPIDTIPIDTIPIDTIPVDTIPIDTIPVDTLGTGSRANLFFYASEIQLYPNPVMDNATLTIKTQLIGDINVEFVSISGKKAGSHNFTKSSNKQSFNLDLSDLAPGSYICLVSAYGLFETISFVKLD